jgi:hypothetical protein
MGSGCGADHNTFLGFGFGFGFGFGRFLSLVNVPVVPGIASWSYLFFLKRVETEVSAWHDHFSQFLDP